PRQCSRGLDAARLPDRHRSRQSATPLGMNKVSSSTDRACRQSSVVLSLLLFATPRLYGADPFTEAVHRGNADEIRSFLAGQPDLQAGDVDGNRPLHWAALNGDARLVKELLQRGALS